MVWQLIFGIIGFGLLLQPLTTEAYAQDFQTAKPTFFFKLQTIYEDVRLFFASGEEKSRLALEYADDKQEQIQQHIVKGQRVPMDLEDRRIQLLEKVEINDTPNKTVIVKLKDGIMTAGELNEIKILYSEFKTCVDQCNDRQKNDFNKRVNSLDSWKTRCKGTFDINNFEDTRESYNKLAKTHCPELEDLEKVKQSLRPQPVSKFYEDLFGKK